MTLATRAAVATAAVLAAVLLAACSAPSTSSTSAATDVPPTPASGPTTSSTATPYVDPTRFTVAGEQDVRFQGFSVRLAGAPYECLGTQDDPQDELPSIVPCAAVVHARGPGLDDDWLASNGVVLADPGLVRGQDLARTSTTVLLRFLRVYYPDGYARPVPLRDGRVDVSGASGRAYRRVVRVPVHQKDLPTTSDTVEIVVVRLASGRVVGWWSVLPDDAEAVDRTAAAASRASLAVSA